MSLEVWSVVQMAWEKELAAKNRLEKEVDRWKSSDGKELERLRTEMASLEQVKEDSVLELRRLELRCVSLLYDPGGTVLSDTQKTALTNLDSFLSQGT